MKAVLVLALCVAVALAATPTRPTPPESYEARIHFDIENRTAFIHRDGDGMLIFFSPSFFPFPVFFVSCFLSWHSFFILFLFS